jgi:hypothetical protein
MQKRFCWMAAVIGCFLLGHPWPTAAQTANTLSTKAGVSVGIGGTKADSASGVEFSLGGILRVGPLFAEVNLLDAILLGEDSAFYSSTGNFRGEEYATCINSQNGEEVGTSSCSGGTIARNAPTVNFGLVIPKTPLFFGAGHRFDGKELSTWYGSGGIMYQIPGNAVITLRTNVGPSYFSMTSGISLLF